jgi:hypothetical protein
VAGVECRCEEVTYLYGEEAWEYAEHLDTVASQPGQWLVRCPNTGIEYVKDPPVDPRSDEWVGTWRHRRFPLTDPDAQGSPSSRPANDYLKVKASPAAASAPASVSTSRPPWSTLASPESSSHVRMFSPDTRPFGPPAAGRLTPGFSPLLPFAA